MCKQGDIVCAFSTFCQLCEDEEPFPASTFFAHACRLNSDSQRVEVAIGHAALPHDSNGSEPTKEEEDEGKYNTACEDPSRDAQRYSWLDLAGPSVECEKVDSRESVNTVDGEGDDKHQPYIGVGNIRPTRVRLEIVKILAILAIDLGEICLANAQYIPISVPP